MNIRTVDITNLHGYLSFKLRFNDSINIVIGTNGSGKTSLLNTIAWVLSPTTLHMGIPYAQLLSEITFDNITISLSEPGQRRYTRVRATPKTDGIQISVDGIEPHLFIPKATRSLANARHTLSDDSINDPQQLIIRHLQEERNNPTLQKLESLIGPLYLPLDRRWHEVGERERPSWSRRSTGPAYLPVRTVLRIAEEAWQEEQHSLNQLNAELREQLLISLFQIDTRESSSEGGYRIWSDDEIRDSQTRINNTLTNLGVHDVESVTKGYFEWLSEYAEEVRQRFKEYNLHRDNDEYSDSSELAVTELLRFLQQQAPLSRRLEFLVELIHDYDIRRQTVTSRSQAFLDYTNSFLSDTKTTIIFDRRGYIKADLNDGNSIPAYLLSSGEIQLLILFTFLIFGAESDQEFPILIDEPELSLHVSWQQKYLERVSMGNRSAQIIVATHSPEIVAGYDDSIIDISPRQPTRP